MAYVAHHAALNAQSKDGSTVRDAYLVEAERAQRKHGEWSAAHLAALAKVDGPPMPFSLAYLFDWFNELFGRSGKEEGAFLPLTYTTIADWARLMRRRLRPHEVAALIQLDEVRRDPARYEATHG